MVVLSFLDCMAADTGHADEEKYGHKRQTAGLFLQRVGKPCERYAFYPL